MHRPARLGLRQRHCERQAGAAPRERGVVGHANVYTEQHGQRAQQPFGLPPWTAKGQALQVPGLDRHVRIVTGASALAGVGRMPRRERHPGR